MYKPKFEDPLEELEMCLSFYRELVNHITDYDGMEIDNILSCRDGLQWAFDKLNNKVDLEKYLQEVKALDRKLLKNASYILSFPDSIIYARNHRRSEKLPRSYWWWYLDELAEFELPDFSEPAAEREAAGS